MTKKYKYLHPLVMWLTVLVGAVILWHVVPDGELFSQTAFGIIVFTLTFINWVFVYATTLSVNPRAFSNINSVTTLITEGRYAAARHPMYLADFILGVGIFFWFPSFHVLASITWLVLVLAFWASMEERALEEKFLEDYRAYRKRVPMFSLRRKKN